MLGVPAVLIVLFVKEVTYSLCLLPYSVSELLLFLGGVVGEMVDKTPGEHLVHNVS